MADLIGNLCNNNRRPRQLILKPLHMSLFIRQLKSSSEDVKMANLLLPVDYAVSLFRNLAPQKTLKSLWWFDFLDFSLNNFYYSFCTHLSEDINIPSHCDNKCKHGRTQWLNVSNCLKVLLFCLLLKSAVNRFTKQLWWSIQNNCGSPKNDWRSCIVPAIQHGCHTNPLLQLSIKTKLTWLSCKQGIRFIKLN